MPAGDWWGFWPAAAPVVTGVILGGAAGRRVLSDAAMRLLGGDSPESAYRALFEQVAVRLGLDTHFHYSVGPAGDELRLESSAGVPAETARAMSRLAFGQAVCGSIAVELDYAPEGVRLRVRDDGTGLAPSAPPGFGLVGMRERAQRIGGELTLASQAGRGTEVAVTVPSGRAQRGGSG